MTANPNSPRPGSAEPDAPVNAGRAHTTGLSDGLGDRSLVFDSASGTSLEVLRFKKEFDTPAFEAALRARVTELSGLRHASLAAIRSVERRPGDGLCLVSKHVSGRRVSELADKARGPAFALELIREVTPALAALQHAGPGVAHGALSTERIIVTREGRLVVTEYVLGSALEALPVSRQRLHQLGSPVPAGADAVRFDTRTDLIQIGFVALSLLLGRRLDAADYPANVPALLDEFVVGADSAIVAAKLRAWLERALQISPRSFASATEAHAAFNVLPDAVDLQLAANMPTPLAVPVGAPRAVQEPPPAPREPRREAARPPVLASPSAILSAPPPEASVPRVGRTRTITASLAVLAAIEAVTIGVLLYTRPATEVVEIRTPPVETQAATAIPAPLPAPEVAVAPGGSAEVTAQKTDPAPPAPAEPAPPAPAGPRFGAVTVSSTLDLQVFKDGALVGSTTGPIALNEGTQNLEFVNEALGFRLKQTLNVKAGRMTSVNIVAPNGRLSINAVPWAEVSIDGAAVGQTPLANLSLAIGTHEIVFRHPELGERKQTVVVKAEGLTKVTQTFGQEARH